MCYKSFDKDYDKNNANLHKIDLYRAFLTHCFITQDNKHIIIINKGIGYNVYNIQSDKWISGQTMSLSYSHSRSLLIDDRILIVSEAQHIILYDISDIRKPVKITSHILGIKVKINDGDYNDVPSFRDCHYIGHGICLIDYNSELNNKNGNRKYNFTIVLCGGGFRDIPFLKSFVELEISLSLNKFVDVVNTLWNSVPRYGVKINEKHISCQNIIVDEKKHLEILATKPFGYFGLQCVQTHTQDGNETFLIIIGYDKRFNKTNDFFNEKSIVLFNYTKKTMQCKANVCVI